MHNTQSDDTKGALFNWRRSAGQQAVEAGGQNWFGGTGLLPETDEPRLGSEEHLLRVGHR